jgi:uncharacterized protein YjiS (DUF1127 family)
MNRKDIDMPSQSITAPSFASLFRTPRPLQGTRHLHRLLALAAARRERRRLEELPDHLLKDVGLTREEAITEARRKPWDVPPGWRTPIL